jgi:hypothetical protein
MLFCPCYPDGKHRFVYPSENGTVDLEGRCKCGMTQISHGLRWVVSLESKYYSYTPLPHETLERWEMFDHNILASKG